MGLKVNMYKKPNANPPIGYQITDDFPRDKQFYQGVKFLTGVGIGAVGVGGLGIFGLGAKNDKSN